MPKQDLALTTVNWSTSTCAAAIFPFEASLIITAICLHDFLCVEIRPQIFIEPDSKKAHSEGRREGIHPMWLNLCKYPVLLWES